MDRYLYFNTAACRSSHPELRKGSSLVVHLGGLQVDYYPYHLSSKSRGHWLGYTDNILSKWHRADHQGFYQEQFPFPSPNGDLVSFVFVPFVCFLSVVMVTRGLMKKGG